MSYSATRTNDTVHGNEIVQDYTLTDVQDSGANTVATGLRRIFNVVLTNTSGTGNCAYSTSGGTITLTAETNDDDFTMRIWGI